MKYLFYGLLIFLLAIPIISATCNEGQIDINSASIEELQTITQIGETRAGYLVELRPFNSVDELIKVNGIAEGRLNQIKEQGLACVEEEVQNDGESDTFSEYENPNEGQDLQTEEIIEEENSQEISSKIFKEKPVPEVIKLTPKNIKSKDNKEKLDKKNLVKYGFVIFCILLGVLFILKGKKYKNEFD